MNQKPTSPERDDRTSKPPARFLAVGNTNAYLAYMEPVKVDQDRTIHLDALVPGAFYQAEVIGPDEITLRRVAQPSPTKRDRDEVLRALQQSSLRFGTSWDDLRRETRE